MAFSFNGVSTRVEILAIPCHEHNIPPPIAVGTSGTSLYINTYSNHFALDVYNMLLICQMNIYCNLNNTCISFNGSRSNTSVSLTKALEKSRLWSNIFENIPSTSNILFSSQPHPWHVRDKSIIDTSHRLSKMKNNRPRNHN